MEEPRKVQFGDLWQHTGQGSPIRFYRDDKDAAQWGKRRVPSRGLQYSVYDVETGKRVGGTGWKEG